MFCEKCGNEMINKKCPNCGFIKWDNPIPVAVALIPILTNDQIVQLLAVKRNIDPKKGELALPGGFQEIEPISNALKREVFEECGLSIALDPSFDQLVLSTEPVPNRLLVFIVCKTLNEQDINFNFKDDKNEIDGLFLVDKFSKLAFPLHEKAVKWYFSKLEYIAYSKATSQI